MSFLHNFSLILSRYFLSVILFLSVSFTASFLESFGLSLFLPLFDILLTNNTNSIVNYDFIFRYFQDFFNISSPLSFFLSSIIIIFILKFIFIGFREYLRSYIMNNFKRDSFLRVSNHLVDLDYSKFLSMQSGHLISDLNLSLVNASSYLFKSFELISNLISIVLLLFFLYVTQNEMVLVSFLFLALIFLPIKFYFGRFSKKVGILEISYTQSIYTNFSNLVSYMRDFRLNNLFESYLANMASDFSHLRKVDVSWATLSSSLSPFIELILVLGFSLYLLNTDISLIQSSIPSLTVLILLSHRLFTRFSVVSNNLIALDRFAPHFQKIQSYFTFDVSLSSNQADFTFKTISFRDLSLFDGDKLIFDKLTFDLTPGSSTAIVGPSGSGKSSLVDLILGLRSFNSGDILFDSRSIDSIPFDCIRSNISVVSQSTNLFNASIAENILIGNTSASREDIKNICDFLDISDFIYSFPKNFDTQVGTDGALLSGGQVQRILLARALISKPSILILDEFTSSLDSVTENLINQKVFEFMSGKTILIISHRTSVLQHCDFVYDLTNHKLVLRS